MKNNKKFDLDNNPTFKIQLSDAKKNSERQGAKEQIQSVHHTPHPVYSTNNYKCASAYRVQKFVDKDAGLPQSQKDKRCTLLKNMALLRYKERVK